MEEILAALVWRAGSSESSRQTQGVDTASDNTTLSTNIPRKKSMFTLASELFKQNRPEFVESEINKLEQHERSRGQWNPFASLRGLKYGRKRAADLLTLRGTGSSPQRNNDSGIDEFCTPKTMRRKSLQDLLGTVGNKLSMARRLVYNDDTIQRLEAPVDESLITLLEALREPHDISPLILPEPALPFAGEPNTLSGYPCLDVEEVIPNEVPNFQDNLARNRECEKLSSDFPSPENKGRLSSLNENSNVSDVIEIKGMHRAVCNSEEPEHMSPILLPEELFLIVPPISTQNADPQESTRINFTDVSNPPQHKDSDEFEDGISLQGRNLDRLFPARSLRRESRYKSLWDATQPESWDLLTSDIGDHIAITAAKVSKNSHLTNIQTRWSVDSSETDTDDMSGYSWVDKEMEVRDIIDRGEEIMKLGVLSPYLHSITVSQTHRPDRSADSAEDDTRRILAEDETHPESPHSENPMAQIVDKAVALDIKPKASPEKKRVTSLENGERFRPRRTNSRLVSVEPVHIVYPANEFCEAQTKTYASKSSAFGDLYQNHSGYSDYCLFDRSTRTYYPQAISYPVLGSPQPDDDSLEVVWLPLEMFPLDPLVDQTDEGDDKTTCSKERNLVLNKSSKQPSVPEAGQNLTLDPTVLSKVENTTSSFSHDTGDSSYLGDETRYAEPALHLDLDVENQSIYSGTLISIREVSNLSTESLLPKDPELQTDKADDPYEIAVDPAMARLYLGSQFSSTGTLQLIREDNDTQSLSAQSSMSYLKKAQTAKPSQVKTWFDMERDFLNRFAPGSHLSQDRRGRIAVYEAFKKLKGLADVPDEEDSDESDHDYEDEFEIEHIEMARFGEASTVFDLGYVAASSSDISEGSCENAHFNSGSEIKYKGKGKESFAQPYLNHKPSGELHNLWHCSADTGMSSRAVDSSFFLIEGNKNENYRDSRIVAMGEHRRLGSDESSETDDIPIAMLSGYMFTHYAEQLGQLYEEASQEEARSERESDHQSVVSLRSGRPTDAASNFVERKNVQTTPLFTLPQAEEKMGGDRHQLSILSENRKGELVKATSIPVCRRPSQSHLAQLMPGRSTSMNSDISSDISFLRPCSAIQKRVLTPNKRIQTPLIEIISQNNPTARAASLTLSEANTEASDTFGQKLERYRRIEEEEKENDHWWTDSISYG